MLRIGRCFPRWLMIWNEASATILHGRVGCSCQRANRWQRWHAKPKETIRVEIAGRVWNRQADSCIHQLLVLLDKEIVAEVYNGVPSHGRDIRMTKAIVAPLVGHYSLIGATTSCDAPDSAIPPPEPPPPKKCDIPSPCCNAVTLKIDGAFVGVGWGYSSDSLRYPASQQKKCLPQGSMRQASCDREWEGYFGLAHEGGAIPAWCLHVLEEHPAAVHHASCAH